MNRIIRHMQTCALSAVLFCAPNALAMKQFKTLPITNNPEAKDTAQNILVGPATVLKEDGAGNNFNALMLDNALLAIAKYSEIEIWDLISGQKKYSLNHGEWLNQGTENPPLKLASDSIISFGEHTVKVWDLKDFSCKNEIKTGKGWEEEIQDVLSITNKRIATCSRKKFIKIWDLGTKEGKCIQTFKEHNGKVNVLLKITDKYIASGSDDLTVKIWDIETGECVRTFFGHKGSVRKLSKISDTCIASGDHKGIVMIWNVHTGKCEQTLVGKQDWIDNLITSSNRVIAVYTRGYIQMWDVNTGMLLNDFLSGDGNSCGIEDLIVVNNKTLISGLYCGTVEVWDLNKEILVQSINCGSTVENIFIVMLQNVPTFVAVTYWGAIITCPCKFETVDENII